MNDRRFFPVTDRRLVTVNWPAPVTPSRGASPFVALASLAAFGAAFYLARHPGALTHLLTTPPRFDPIVIPQL